MPTDMLTSRDGLKFDPGFDARLDTPKPETPEAEIIDEARRLLDIANILDTLRKKKVADNE